MHGPTQKTHFIPAFWAALWNEAYLAGTARGRAREQSVSVLNLKADKIHVSKVEDVFCEKGLGLAEMTAESIHKNAHLVAADRRILRSILDEIKRSGPVTLDTENLNNAIEGSPTYRTLIDVARTGVIQTHNQKAFIACCAIHLRMRHPNVIARLVAMAAKSGIDKWVVLDGIRHLWSQPEWLLEQVAPLVLGKWILHRSPESVFPLGDLAVVENSDTSRIWFALSPRVLLEICVNQHSRELASTRELNLHRERSLLRHYRRLCISRATRQIIFHSHQLLAEWRSSADYAERLHQELVES